MKRKEKKGDDLPQRKNIQVLIRFYACTYRFTIYDGKEKKRNI